MIYIYIYLGVSENVVYPQDSYFSHDHDNEPNEPLNLGVSYVQTSHFCWVYFSGVGWGS